MKHKTTILGSIEPFLHRIGFAIVICVVLAALYDYAAPIWVLAAAGCLLLASVIVGLVDLRRTCGASREQKDEAQQ